MSSKLLDDEYETCAPQWTDFTETTPNREVAYDDYFDRFHEHLEALSPINSEKDTQNHLPVKVNSKNKKPSTLFLNTPKTSNSNMSESTFIDDIDQIHMTPIKITSPKTKNKKPIVMQELSVNEALTTAIRGLEIASAKSNNGRKSKILNATVCPSSATNTKISSLPRKIRISRSMQVQPSNSSNGKTPAAKAAATPRNLNPPKLIVTTADSIEHICVYKAPKHDDSTMEYKTPVKFSNHMHDNTLLSRNSPNISSKIVKTPKLKLLSRLSNTSDDANEVVAENIVHDTPISENEMEIAEITAVEQPNKIEVKTKENVENHEVFEKNLDNFDEIFEVHHSNYGKTRGNRTKQPSFVTNPARRRSSIASRRRRSNKYISLAEAVSTFQRSTPTRFHTVSKLGAVQRIKQQTITKSTIPVSPALTSKTRVRRHEVLSQAQREELELQNMRKQQIHANPIRPAILVAPETLKAVPKKPITVPQPFKLSGKQKITKTSSEAPATTVSKTLKAVPKKPSTLPKPIHSSGKPKSTHSQLASSISSSSLISSASHTSHSSNSRSKRVIALTPSEDSQTLEAQEIINFEIPATVNLHDTRYELRKKPTRPQPFQLDERHKRFLNKKEEKLKMLQEEEAKKLKFEFHARPVPAAVKKNSCADTAKDKIHKLTTSSVQTVPFSFENRDKMAAKKKEELRKKMEEEERKARVFHANPAPVFKPVVVRSVSRDNLKVDTMAKSSDNLTSDRKMNEFGKSTDKLVHITRGKSADSLKPAMKMKRNQSADNLKVMKRINSNDNIKINSNTLNRRANSVECVHDQENIPPNRPVSKSIHSSNMPALKPKLKALPVELHSDKRARMRREYDEKIKIKLEQDEQRRKKEEESRLARQQAEIAAIRKKAEIKARPMPVYKPLVVAKSTKPLTEAESPAWSKIKR